MITNKERNVFKLKRPDKALSFVPPGSVAKPKTNWGNFEKPGHLYSSARWQRLREMVLTENPLCYFCGCIADQVHHIEKGEDLFFFLGNLVSICEGCHAKVNSAYRRKIDKSILFGERCGECQE